MGDLLKACEDGRTEVEGRQEMQRFFKQPGTAYVTEREDQTLRYMARLGIALDETTLTGLETWHMLDQGFCPAIGLELGHLWVRLTASFRGTSSSGWTWHNMGEENKELTPEQARLAFALGNSMASLALDGVVARIDPEDLSPLRSLGTLILKAEQEGILEGEETLGMRALRLEAGDEAAEGAGEVRPMVRWSNLQKACREPFGRVGRIETAPIPEEQTARVMERHDEVIEDLVTWEEAIGFTTLLGPQHQRPVVTGNLQLPERAGKSILRGFELEAIRRANERLGLDPDDMDYARVRFPDLRTAYEVTSSNRTPSPPPPVNLDIHGLWEEEKHRRGGGRHRGPPRLRWNPPIPENLPRERHCQSGTETRKGGWKPGKRPVARPPGNKQPNHRRKRLGAMVRKDRKDKRIRKCGSGKLEVTGRDGPGGEEDGQELDGEVLGEVGEVTMKTATHVGIGSVGNMERGGAANRVEPGGSRGRDDAARKEEECFACKRRKVLIIGGWMKRQRR